MGINVVEADEADLIACGFPSAPHEGRTRLRTDAPLFQLEDEIDTRRCHINIYELIALLIQKWILLRLLFEGLQPPPGSWVVEMLADNTSALSWLRYAARTSRPPVCHLARSASRANTFTPASTWAPTFSPAGRTPPHGHPLQPRHLS